MMIRTATLALSLAIGSVPAIAAPATDSVTTEVRTDDLDLTTARDQKRLDMRINSAARTLCRADNRGVAESLRQTQCVAAALASAEPQAARAVAQSQTGTQVALLMVSTAR